MGASAWAILENTTLVGAFHKKLSSLFSSLSSSLSLVNSISKPTTDNLLSTPRRFVFHLPSRKRIAFIRFHSTGNSLVQIDQSHRYGRHQAACREPAGSYDKTTRTVICFEHKTQYLLIRAPYTRMVVFWHISNILPMISRSQISCNAPTFGCYNS